MPEAEIGDLDKTGDPYLNKIYEIIRTKIVYPPRAGVLNLRGYVVYRLIVDNSGRLLKIELMQPSGAQILDKAAWDALVASQPFPAPPPGFPAQFGLMVTIPLAPD